MVYLFKLGPQINFSSEDFFFNEKKIETDGNFRGNSGKKYRDDQTFEV